ncbi:MAG: hypothetical protein IAF38_04250 [Bacteroidia bacterium]|nr:hypothetical protein [Bacteroidia bacterium]
MNYSEKDIRALHPHEQIFDMLALLKRFSAMYLSSVSVVALGDFLSGYLSTASYPVKDQWDNLIDWLRKKKEFENEDFGMHGNGFYRIFMQMSGSDSVQALELFFNYVEEYKREKNIVTGKIG